MQEERQKHSTRILCKVRKTQHQNPEFGHKLGEIFKNTAKKWVQEEPRREREREKSYSQQPTFLKSSQLFILPEEIIIMH